MADESRRGSESTVTPPFDGYEPHEEFATPTAPPTGLDLHPKPQGAVRVKKSIGVTVALGGFVLVFVIAISIIETQGRRSDGNGETPPYNFCPGGGGSRGGKAAGNGPKGGERRRRGG